MKNKYWFVYITDEDQKYYEYMCDTYKVLRFKKKKEAEEYSKSINKKTNFKAEVHNHIKALLKNNQITTNGTIEFVREEHGWDIWKTSSFTK